MPDERFFKRSGSFTLKQLAEKTGAQIGESADPDYMLEDVMALDKAGPKHLSFLDNVKYKQQFAETKAGACFVAREYAGKAPDGLNLLISPSPYKAYAIAAQAFYPDNPPQEESISDRAVIHETAKIGKNCFIEAGAVIGPGAVIGDQCRIGSCAVIGENVQLGTACRIGSNASVSHAILGHHVRLYPGVRVGQDGFGFAIDPAGHVKVPQLGRVIIGDHVEVGANTCIDRGAGPDTEIGAGTWIDNLVQIGHNVKIGKGCVIVAQVGISGSSVIEDFVAIGGQAGVTGHLRVGQGAKIAAQSGVMRDVPPGDEQAGTPAVTKKEVMKQIVALKRLANSK